MQLLEDKQDVQTENRNLKRQLADMEQERNFFQGEVERLKEVNRTLQGMIDDLKQRQIAEKGFDWIAEYHELQHKYRVLDQQAGRLEDKNLYLQERLKELEEQVTPRTRQAVCEECGHTFQEQVKGRKARFCSARCRKRHQRTEDLFRKAKAHTKQTLTEIIL